MKTCTNPNCKEINPQPLSNFYKLSREADGLNFRCKSCIKEYRNSPKEKRRVSQYHRSVQYRLQDIGRNKNPIRRAKVNERRRLRRKEDPVYRLRRNLSRRTNAALKRGSFQRKSSILTYLGCSIEDLKIHLEKQFDPTMTWANYGYGKDKWNIDHKIPLASAPSVEMVYALCHYSNLQPMWQPKNIKKSNKLIY